MPNIQLKGNSPQSPWLVLDGTIEEILDALLEVYPHLRDYASGPESLPKLAALAREQWAAETLIEATVGPTTQVDSSHAQSTSASQGQGAAGNAQRTGTETDKWGNTYEWGHPKAPLTPSGQPAVLKRCRSKQGKDYAKWIDPRDKYIPSVYASGQKVNPPDLWPGDWARGV